MWKVVPDSKGDGLGARLLPDGGGASGIGGFSSPAAAAGVAPVSVFSKIHDKKIFKLARTALDTRYCPIIFAHKTTNPAVIKICFHTADDQAKASASLQECNVKNILNETLDPPPSRDRFPHSHAVTFAIPSKFRENSNLLATYVEVFLNIANRIRELKSELHSCWTWTKSAKDIKQAKINGLEKIMTEITDPVGAKSLDVIIEEALNNPDFRLKERRILCGTSNTEDTLDKVTAVINGLRLS